MKILGTGIVFARGRGLGALEQALHQGWAPPVEIEAAFGEAGRFPVYAVPADVLADKAILGKMRRADRFSKMAVLAAADAVAAGAGLRDPARTGVILATALGPHVTTFSFLDGILDYGDVGVSPTAFSHSVHNAAAAYLAMVLGIRGPVLTLTQFDFPFHEALRLAACWLREKRCDQVLVGSVDELGAVMEYACSRMLTVAPDRRIKPFSFAPRPECVPGEGSVFMLVAADGVPGAPDIGVADDETRPNLLILDADGMGRDETAYRETVAPGVTAAGYAPLFGSLLAGSAFSCAVAALMLERQTRYACPVADNPRGIPLCTATASAALRRLACVKVNCTGEKRVIRLTRDKGIE